MKSETELPRHMLRIQLNDKSAKPDAALCERLAHRKPYDEDIAIQDCWAFRAPTIRMDLSTYEAPTFHA